MASLMSWELEGEYERMGQCSGCAVVTAHCPYPGLQWQAVTSKAEWQEKYAAWWRNCQFKAADKASAAQRVAIVRDSDRSKEASDCVSGEMGKVSPPTRGLDSWKRIFTEKGGWTERPQTGFPIWKQQFWNAPLRCRNVTIKRGWYQNQAVPSTWCWFLGM